MRSVTISLSAPVRFSCAVRETPQILTWGARYEKHNSFGGHVSPRAYLVWNMLDDWTLKGWGITGFKTPSSGQLHNGVSGIAGHDLLNTVGNPDL